MSESCASRIAVVGSLNADVTLWVPKRPSPDETLHAERIAWFRGGKGANQAVAAARLGASVVMVGCVGDDEQGRWLRSGLEAEGIDCTHVRLTPEPTGLAVITVDPDDVSIVVAAGANGCLDADGVQAAAEGIATADALLLQGEVGARAARTAAEIARWHGTLVVLNPAPYNDVAPAVLPLADIVIVNRAESEQLHAGGSVAELRRGALLVETLGAAGCVIRTAHADEPAPPMQGSGGAPGNIGDITRVIVPAPHVAVTDATGAGDAFAAAFAVGIASGAEPAAAGELAVRAGAWAVTVAGAQPSLPRLDQLESLPGSPAGIDQATP